MKVTKVLARAVSAAFASTNLNADQAFDLLTSPGVFRGAHNLALADHDKSHDELKEMFGSYRVDRVIGLEDGVVIYETVAKEGKALPKALANLLVSAGVIGATPAQGEHVMCVGWDTEKETEMYFPAIVQSGVHADGITCAGVSEENGKLEVWAADFKPEDLLIPTVYIGGAGLLSRHAFDTNFQQEGGTHVSVDELPMVDARLSEAGLTFNDLFTYMAVEDEEVEATKFYKKLMKKHRVTVNHDLLTFLKTGEYVELAANEAQEAPVSPLVEFAAYVTHLRGAPLADLYSAVCKVARIKEGDRQTVAAKVKKHIIDSTTEARLANLIKAGAYQPHEEKSKAA